MRSVSIITGLLLLASCVGPRNAEIPPEEVFGHRETGEGPGGRRTLTVTQPDSAESYFFYPAVFDTVHVRPAFFGSEHAENDQVPVEVLVKGSLPDACSELHDVTQERYGHIIEVTLETRRPQGAVCATVIRPFRFYFKLEGMYAPGTYTLKLNKEPIPFSVRRREAG